MQALSKQLSTISKAGWDAEFLVPDLGRRHLRSGLHLQQLELLLASLQQPSAAEPRCPVVEVLRQSPALLLRAATRWQLMAAAN